MVKVYSAIILFLILLTGCSDEQTAVPTAPVVRPPVDISTQVDRAVATTGDEITYTVTINYDPAAP